MDFHKQNNFVGKTVEGGVMVVYTKGKDGFVVSLATHEHHKKDGLTLRVYHDIEGGEFTAWPNAKTLNREVLTAVVEAFDFWLAECPARNIGIGMMRVYVERRAEYQNALAALR